MKVYLTERPEGSGHWRLRMVRPGCKDTYESLRGTLGDAERRKREILEQVTGGTFVAGSKRTLNEYLEHYLAGMRERRKRSSVERYDEVLGRYVRPKLGSVRIQDITSRDIQAIYDAMRSPTRPGGPLAIGTVRQLHDMLAGIFKRACEYDHWIAVNPMKKLTGNDAPPVPRPNPKVFEQEELEKLLAALAGHWLEDVIQISLVTGMRRGELCGLRWRDIEFNRQRLSVRFALAQYRDQSVADTKPKTDNAERVIPLSAEATGVLQRRRAAALEAGFDTHDGYVFSRDGTAPLTPDTISNCFRYLLLQHGLGHLSLHKLRHTHATDALSKAQPHEFKAISERLGHSDIRTTQSIYQKVSETDQRAIADRTEGMLARLKGGGRRPRLP